MAEPDEARADVAQTSVTARQSRIFWTTSVLAIVAILLLCTALILIAATQS
jgi:CHASE3 domain sensor protein